MAYPGKAVAGKDVVGIGTLGDVGVSGWSMSMPDGLEDFMGPTLSSRGTGRIVYHRRSAAE